MKVTVFFEAKAGAHVVAQFDEESTYMACLPALEVLAKSQGYIVTESVGAETEKWVVTVFFDHEPSRVYGLFDSEELAMAWAESNRDGWDAMVVQQLRGAV
jgi:hypothetical protein